MCGGLRCAVVGSHNNCNKLRYSFNVLILRTRKCVIYGAVSRSKDSLQFDIQISFGYKYAVRCHRHANNTIDGVAHFCLGGHLPVDHELRFLFFIFLHELQIIKP